MSPTAEQVRVAAYHRWERRGGWHGAHLDDWVAAEQGLLFLENYELAARYRLDGGPVARLGRAGRRVCRFCEQAEPRTRFTDAAPAVPECLGGDALRTLDQCDECRSVFRESLDEPLADFVRAMLRSAAGGPEPGQAGNGVGIPIAAYKALVKSALTILPADDLDLFPDAIEWVCNPDHDLDGHSFADAGCYLHSGPGTPHAAWAALARKSDDDAPLPTVLAFFGAPGLVFELPLPLCARDEDFEGERLVVPRVACPESPIDWRGPVETRFLPIAAAPTRRRLALSWAD